MIEVNYNEYKETIEENIRLIVQNSKLKQENIKLKDIRNEARKQIKELEDRIDKAIEYLMESSTTEEDLKKDEIYGGGLVDLLHILQGK